MCKIKVIPREMVERCLLWDVIHHCVLSSVSRASSALLPSRFRFSTTHAATFQVSSQILLLIFSSRCFKLLYSYYFSSMIVIHSAVHNQSQRLSHIFGPQPILDFNKFYAEKILKIAYWNFCKQFKAPRHLFRLQTLATNG